MQINFVHKQDGEVLFDRHDDFEYCLHMLRTGLKAGQEIIMKFGDNSSVTFNPPEA